MSKDNKTSAKAKNAFLICPIGEEGSPIRERLDQMYTYVIEPVAKECDYKIQHAGQISKPGLVTTQIVSCIMEADLIIADLTGRNANVMYELALCHILKKPTVQIIEKGETLPFDISISRTIQIDHKNLKSVHLAMEELGKQIRNVEAKPEDVDSPIAVAIGVQALSQSGDPQKEAIAELRSLTIEAINQIEEIRKYLIKRDFEKTWKMRQQSVLDVLSDNQKSVLDILSDNQQTKNEYGYILEKLRKLQKECEQEQETNARKLKAEKKKETS